MSYIQNAWTEDLLGNDQDQKNAPKSNRSSSMGIDCIRSLYYKRMCPENAKPFPIEALARMREGTEQEEAVKHHLTSRKLGLKLTRGQVEFDFKDLNLTGHWEGFLENHPEYSDPIMYEIKTTERFMFDKLNTIEDFRSNKWWNRYLKQVTCYMKAAETDKILFIVKDRASWRIKEFEYRFEENLWIDICNKLKTLNEHIKDNKIPEDQYCADFRECSDCRFLDFCQPYHITINPGYERVDDPELLEMLNRREEIKADYNEYKEIDEAVKAQFKGRNAFISTEYEIVSKLINVKGDPFPKPKLPSSYYKINIKKI